MLLGILEAAIKIFMKRVGR